MDLTTGATVRPDSLRPLNSPRSIRIRTGRYEEPLAVRLGGAMQGVARIRDRWRVDDHWWTEAPVCRMYFELELQSGETLTLFHDRITNQWYRQRPD